MKITKQDWIAMGAGLVTALTSFFAINFFSRKNRLARKAKFFEDIEEVGNNRSFGNATFEKMMRSVGWSSGDAWCMYFAIAVYDKVLPKQKDKLDKLSGSTQRSWQKVKNGEVPDFIAVTSGKPRKGDIVIWQNLDNSSKGHAGIVIKTTSKEFKNGFTTIEGNTNVNSDFYGSGQSVRKAEHNLDYGQKSKTYPTKKLLGFIRYAPFFA